jgi:hypothetical protein
MNLLNRLPTLLRPAHPVPPPARPAPSEAEPAAEARDWGCGWFDSSHELLAGLQVREHASPDTLARELPLEHWLDLHLAAWRPTPGTAC